MLPLTQHPRGCNHFCLRNLLIDELITNNAYAKNTEDDHLYIYFFVVLPSV